MARSDSRKGDQELGGPPWSIETTDQFNEWYAALSDTEIEDVNLGVDRLEAAGPLLARPFADTVYGSAYTNMKELIVQSGGSPIRIFFAFDPRRTALLIIGGDKTGDKQFYDRMIAIADRLYSEHLEDIKPELTTEKETKKHA